MGIFLTIGPPGTGKTTHLATCVREAVGKYGSQSVLIASLTRAAASEIASRGLPVPKERTGTLHALAWRSVGHPEVAESGKCIAEWNATHKNYALSGGRTDLNEAPLEASPTETRGDDLFRAYTLYRCRLTPREVWRPAVVAFAKGWEDWKAETGRVDFEDMIQLAYQENTQPPGRPWIFYADEAQDWSKSEWRLVLHWAKECHALVIVGDWDQAIYEWRGADPKALLALDVPEGSRRVLSHSYRVPRAVHAVSSRWISKIHNRLDAPYEPRDHEGEVLRLGVTWQFPDPLLARARAYIKAGKSVMVLAACGYMLAPLKAALRDAGVPFHNPYRTRRGDWNPLRGVGKVVDFLRPDPSVHDGGARLWTWRELWSWLQVLDAERCLAHGVKAGIQEIARKAPDVIITEDDLANVFEPPALAALRATPLAWLRENALQRQLPKLIYPIRIYEHFGGKQLLEEPRCVIGTIHSVKGGEADVVFLFPDISPEAMQNWIRAGSDAQAEIIRQFYVGMTRARETLILCERGTRCAVDW